MRIATGIPNTIRNTEGHLFPSWAKTAEALGFSSLGTIGRISYDCYEELMVLAACSAVTQTINLVTTVLLGPIRETALLGKQSATLDRLSAGRFILGLGLGAREEDYEVTQTPYVNRGDQLETQVNLLYKIWEQELVRDATLAIGPEPRRPRLILSGRAEAAIERAGRLADGFIATPDPIDELRSQFSLFHQAWENAGREGRGYLAASRYVVLDPKLQKEAEENVRDYYGFGGPEFIDHILGGMLRTPGHVKEAVESLKETGADELFIWPVTNKIEELHRLAEAAGL